MKHCKPMCFDTTTSNTLKFTAVCILLEAYIRTPFIVEILPSPYAVSRTGKYIQCYIWSHKYFQVSFFDILNSKWLTLDLSLTTFLEYFNGLAQVKHSLTKSRQYRFCKTCIQTKIPTHLEMISKNYWN